MRNQNEMLDLIISTAENDARIRAAYLGGSRTNPNAPKDIFQDYDIMYVVTETRTFYEDRSWLDRFGPRLYMQLPEDSPFFPSNRETCYGWLMQFCDGVRMDLHVCTPTHAQSDLKSEGMYRILLDKDGILPSTSRETDEKYWIKPLSEDEFLSVCNEFWWCTNNVAKGLWRGENTYAMDMLNLHVRPQLQRLLEEAVGLDTNFSVSAGKSGKYLPNFLPEKLWTRYLSTFSPAQTNAMWEAIFEMCALMDETAQQAAAKTGFNYNHVEAQNAMLYLQHVRALPKDAAAVF